MPASPANTIGGQAVIEGVMIRSPHAWSVAVRRPDGAIESRRDPLPRLSSRSRWARVPFVRGVLVLGESLTLGFKALSWSAQKASEDDDVQEITGRHIAVAMTLALVVFVAVFMLAPLGAAKGMQRLVGESNLAFNLVEGLVRVALFVGYIWIIGRAEDIRRVFQYHGAEHKSIYAYEAGDPLMVEPVQRYRTMHPRCGTSFLLIVILLSIVVFTIVGAFGPGAVWLVTSRIVLIPVIAGVSYELLKASGRQRWLAMMAAPGIALQRLTTREPTDDMVEVAIASLLASLDEAALDEVKRRGPVCPPALAAIQP